MNLDSVMTFLDFVAERHRVWERRQAGVPGPWTDDPVLATRKFTNVFRILDPGTQFILNDLLVDPDLGERTTLMRCFLYRHTGRVEAWENLGLTAGYPYVEQLPEALQSMKEYRDGGNRTVFTNAYLVFPQSAEKGTDKLESIFTLTQRLFTPGSPDDIMPDWWKAKTPADRFAVLRRNKGVADFMSMQILTDWGYTRWGRHYDENEFVVPGPGAKRGLDLLGLKDVRQAHEMILALPPGDLPTLLLPSGVRLPSLLDAQNTLCEMSKYVRGPVASSYRPTHPGAQPAPVYPEHW